MRRYLTEQWYEVEECECGGLLVNPANVVYISNPPQRDYTCNKCGKVKRLSSDKWPHFSTTQKETIDSALADAGNTDALELVKRIRRKFRDFTDADYHILTDSEAAALIERYAAKRAPIEPKKMEFIPCEEHEEPRESEIEEINRTLEMAEKVLMDTKTRLNHYQFNTLIQIRKAQDIMADGLPKRGDAQGNWGK